MKPRISNRSDDQAALRSKTVLMEPSNSAESDESFWDFATEERLGMMMNTIQEGRSYDAHPL